ncbi:MAG: hypothetical protein JO218_19665 [Burkholderiales bacterium]|nr:hypothetical protein [Burkholderiales bacterium]
MRPTLLALLFSASALAQSGESITLASDYRFRGLSLNDDKPDARADYAYDGADGWYAGAGLTRVKPYQDLVQGQVLAYGGRRGNLHGDTDWEAGITLAAFTRTSHRDYAEAYVGLLRRDWSLRLYVSPNYYGSGERTAYGEINFNHPLTERFYITAHVGGLTRLGQHGPSGSAAARVDDLIGVGTSIDGWDLQLAWNALSRSPYSATSEPASLSSRANLYGYPTTSTAEQPKLHAWVLSASWFF